jgi:hypothetical protein
MAMTRAQGGSCRHREKGHPGDMWKSRMDGAL